MSLRSGDEIILDLACTMNSMSGLLLRELRQTEDEAKAGGSS